MAEPIKFPATQAEWAAHVKAALVASIPAPKVAALEAWKVAA